MPRRRPHRTCSPRLEPLEPRLLLTANLFGPREIMAFVPVPWPDFQIFDLDEDGDQDVLLRRADWDLPPSWIRNDGEGVFTRCEFDWALGDSDGLYDMHARDMDGDGDLDVVALLADAIELSPWGKQYQNRILWWENDGAGGFGAGTIIATADVGRNPFGWDGRLVDVDGDGDLDLLTTQETYWMQNDGAGHLIPVAGKPAGSMLLDYDLDGDYDLAASGDAAVLLYENQGGGTFAAARALFPSGTGILHVGDFDNDGDVDLLCAGQGTIHTRENHEGTFGPAKVLDSIDSWHYWSTSVSDLDGDGRIDVIADWMDRAGTIHLVWYRNLDGGNYSPSMEVAAREIGDAWEYTVIRTADMNGDGRTDIVGYAELSGTLEWYANLGAPGPTGVQIAGTAVPETAPAGTAAGVLSTVSADPEGTFDYTLVSGEGDIDNAKFTIEGDSLKVAAPLDFETRPTCSIRVRSTNAYGLYAEQTFTVSVTDVNESPTLASLTAAPGEVNRMGEPLTLTANGVADPDAGDAIEHVAFYYDADGNGRLDPAVDTLLGEDADGADGWAWSGPARGVAARANAFFAVAFDGELFSMAAKVEVGFPSLPLSAINGYFDEHLYLLHNPDVAAQAGPGRNFPTGREHFLAYGHYEGRVFSPFYDEDAYLSANPDVAAVVAEGRFATGLEHYLQYGRHEGRLCGPVGAAELAELRACWGGEAYYLQHNPDVADNTGPGQFFRSGFEHFVRYGIAELRPFHPDYNERDYLAGNPDVAESVGSGGAFASGLEHYLACGRREGRDPRPLALRRASEWFSEGLYLRRNADVAAAVAGGMFESGLQHFVRHGRFEGRAFSPWFDEAYYLGHNPQAAAAVSGGRYGCGFDHFLAVGEAAGLAFSPLQAAHAAWGDEFDETIYLQWNADVAGAVGAGQFESGLDHFLKHGRYEGRRYNAQIPPPTGGGGGSGSTGGGSGYTGGGGSTVVIGGSGRRSSGSVSTSSSAVLGDLTLLGAFYGASIPGLTTPASQG